MVREEGHSHHDVPGIAVGFLPAEPSGPGVLFSAVVGVVFSELARVVVASDADGLVVDQHVFFVGQFFGTLRGNGGDLEIILDTSSGADERTLVPVDSDVLVKSWRGVVLVVKTSEDEFQTGLLEVLHDSGPFHGVNLSGFLEAEVDEGRTFGVTVAVVDLGPRTLDVFHSESFSVLPVVAAVSIAVVIVEGVVEPNGVSPVNEEDGQSTMLPSGSGVGSNFGEPCEGMPPATQTAHVGRGGEPFELVVKREGNIVVLLKFLGRGFYNKSLPVVQLILSIGVLEVVGFYELFLECRYQSGGGFVEFVHVGIFVSAWARKVLPVTEFAVDTRVPVILAEEHPEFAGHLMADIGETNTGLTVFELNITEDLLLDATVAEVDVDPFAGADVSSVVDVLHDVPVVTTVVGVSGSGVVEIAGADPESQISVSDLVGVALVSISAVGDSDQIVPGVGLPVDPLHPSVDGIFKLLTGELPSAVGNEIFVSLGTTSPDFVVVDQSLLVQLVLIGKGGVLRHVL